MNIHTRPLDAMSELEQAEKALGVLRAWAKRASSAEIAALDPAISRLLPDRQLTNYPDLSRDYPEGFEVDKDYIKTLPDLQNGPASLIKGSQQQIQHVGISNFRLPIRFHTRDSGDLTLETSVTGTVSLEAGKKGINMSR
ncbi:MAG: GTP cyclohydrolase, FolE2/MptA family, partial [Paracoccaceae bacterium]|nr:GTP cyclohydrolase, FolE2/MptA family [Paracoccaceae bacterium]